MTVKEIAEAVGKEERTIQRWVKKSAEIFTDNMAAISDKMSASSPSKPADYTLEETCTIIETGMGKNAADLYRMSAKAKPSTDDRINRLEAITEKLLLTMGNMMIAIQSNQGLNPLALPDNTPKLLPRDELRRIVNKAANESGDYPGTWKTLYTEIYYRLHINAQERAKNAKVSAIDILEGEGLLENAVLIAREIF